MIAVLRCDFRLTRGSFALRFNTELTPGITALWGDSGAGKTSVLRALAGLDSVVGVIPRSAVGYAPQGARLFPHLTVLENLRFGLRRVAVQDRWCAEAEVIEQLGLAAWLSRKPHELSGGQQQRVALGRALLNQAPLLLLDEPFSALDGATRERLGHWLRDVVQQHQLICLLVSHDRDEVLQLADRLIWLQQGRVTQQGEALALAANWEGPFADQQACSVLPARLQPERAEHGLVPAQCAGGTLWLAQPSVAISEARLLIHARDVALSLEPLPSASIQNTLPVQVESWRELNASSVLVRLRCGDYALWSQVTRRALSQLNLQPGQHVHALIKAVAMVRHG